MTDQEFDYALEVVRNPELTQTEEFRRWMADNEHAEIYWGLLAVSDSLMLESKDLPNTEEALAELRQRLGRGQEKSKRIGRIIRIALRWSAAAAVIAVAICISLQAPKIVYHKTPQVAVTQHAPDTTKKIKTESVKSQARAAEPVSLCYVVTQEGQDTTVTLPDGTQVMLNAKTQLVYPREFPQEIGSRREVELHGEAYFDVHHHTSHPFVVKANGVETRVLGTSFNIRAYEGLDAHVTLVHGRISVKSSKGQTEVLTPGLDAHVVNGRMTVEQVNVHRFTAWTTGYFYFEDTSLYEIMSEISRWYHVNVEFADKQSQEYRFDFWADRHRPVDETVELLRKLGKIHMEFNGHTMRISSNP